MITITREITPGFTYRYEIDYNYDFDTEAGLVYAKLDIYLDATATGMFKAHQIGTGLNQLVLTTRARKQHPYLSSQTQDTIVFSTLGNHGSKSYYNSSFFDTAITSYRSPKEAGVVPGTYHLETYITSEKYTTLQAAGFYNNAVSNMIQLQDGAYIAGTSYQLPTESYTFDGDAPEGLTSGISCSTTYVGELATILIDKWNNNFTTTIDYKFGSLTGRIISKTELTVVQWEVPTSFLSQFGSASTKGTCTLTAYTYDGDNLIGSETFDFNVLMDVNAGGPLFDPYVVDVNQATVALTGNNKILIKYFSSAYAQANAIGQAGATIKGTTITSNGIKTDHHTITIHNVESPIFDFTATDSRGFTTRTRYMASWMDYSKLSCNVFVSTPDVHGNATIKIEGNYFNQSFGSVANTLALKYHMKSEDDADFGEWITVSPEISDSNYWIELQLTGLDYKKLYHVEAQADDKLMSITSNLGVMIGKPVFDWNNRSFHITPPLELDSNIVLDNNMAIVGADVNGDEVNALIPCDGIGNTVLGFGNYQAERGETLIYGNNINMLANQSVSINGRNVGNRILWEGSNLMGDGAQIDLSSPISEQLNGIVLVFSLYRNNAAEDVSINTQFISRQEVELLEGAPHFFFLGVNAGLSIIGSKYLYIYDNRIVGHSGNTINGNNSGITFNNSNYVLRYVIGV